MLRHLTAVTTLALAVTGCATMSVSSHVRGGIDFATYRTYDWGPADALPTGDPRLDQDPYFKDHLMGAVEKQLAARGYVRSSSGTPRLRKRLATDSAMSRFSRTTSSCSRFRTRSFWVAAARASRRAVASRRS